MNTYNISMLSTDLCTGCGACYGVCPTKCIDIGYDEEGFYCPKVNVIRCSQCGKCASICPALNEVSFNKPRMILGMQRKDSAVLSSSSGGIASLLTEYYLDNSGIAYGCVMDDGLVVRHIRADNISFANSLRSSKYVQSFFYDVYASIEKDINNKKDVVLFGTPCQVAAIRKYIGRDYSNLLLVDLICHGVPSPLLFEKYIKWQEIRLKAKKVIAYNFRDKKKGWSYGYWFSCKYESMDDKVRVKWGHCTVDPYFDAFVYGESYRRSCYKCKYAKNERCSDITLGDFWGINKYYPEKNKETEKGFSVVLINTDKGLEKIKSIERLCVTFETSIEIAEAENGNLREPASCPEIRNHLYRMVDRYGMNWLRNRMLKSNRYYMNRIKCMVPKRVKRIIRRVIK